MTLSNILRKHYLMSSSLVVRRRQLPSFHSWQQCSLCPDRAGLGRQLVTTQQSMLMFPVVTFCDCRERNDESVNSAGLIRAVFGYRLEAAKDDYRIRCEELEKEISELRQQNEELTTLADEAQSLKDEIDVLR